MRSVLGWIFLSLGLAAVAAGSLSIYQGSDIIQIERGWASVIAGASLLAGGLVTMALAGVIFKLETLTAKISRPASVETVAVQKRIEEQGPIAPEPPRAPVMPILGAAVAAAVPATVAPSLSTSESEAEHHQDHQSSIHEEYSGRKPAGEVESTLDWLEEGAPEAVSHPAELAAHEDLEKAHELNLNDAVAESRAQQTASPHAPLDLHHLARPQLAPEPDQPRFDLQLPVVEHTHASAHVEQISHAAVDDLIETGWLERALTEELNAPIIPEPEPRPPEPRAPEPRRRETGALETGAMEPRHFEHTQMQAEPAHSEHTHADLHGEPVPAYSQAAPGDKEIVTHYDMGGVRYTMYLDGSIDADDGESVRQFESIEQLKEFIAKSQPAH